MEDSIVTLGVYFEVKDAHFYGGDGSIGYCNTNVDFKISNLLKADVYDYVEELRKRVADLCHVDAEKVRVISRTEYEDNTEGEDDDYEDDEDWLNW